MGRKPARSQRTAMALSLPESHWKQFLDVRWPERHDAQIEHVLVGPSGVHVIKYRSANSGHAATKGIGPHGAGRSLDAAVMESSEAAHAVGGLLPARYRSTVRPVMCFREDEPVADLVGNVMVTSRLALEHIVRASPIVLSTGEVAEVWASLDARLEAVPALPAPALRSWALFWKSLAVAATAAAAAGVVAFGPALVEVSRIW